MLENNYNDENIFTISCSIKEKLRTDFNPLDCINKNFTSYTLKRKRHIRLICVLSTMTLLLILCSIPTALAEYKKLFHTVAIDQGLDKAAANGYAKSMYLYSESNGVKLAVTACISDETRTVIQVEVSGDYKRRDVITLSGITLKDENNNTYTLNHWGEGMSNNKTIPQSTLIQFTGGSLKDCVATLHVASINGIEGDWNIKIPIVIKSSKKYSTEIHFSKDNVSIDISEITFAPTQTVVKFFVHDKKFELGAYCSLSNDSESVKYTSADSHLEDDGYRYVINFGSISEKKDLTLKLIPNDENQPKYEIKIPVAKLIPED